MGIDASNAGRGRRGKSARLKKAPRNIVIASIIGATGLTANIGLLQAISTPAYAADDVVDAPSSEASGMSPEAKQAWQKYWQEKVKADVGSANGVLGENNKNVKSMFGKKNSPFATNPDNIARYKGMVADFADSLASPDRPASEAWEKLTALKKAFPGVSPQGTEVTWIPTGAVTVALEYISAKRMYEAGLTELVPGDSVKIESTLKPDYASSEKSLYGDHVRMVTKAQQGKTLEESVKNNIGADITMKVGKYKDLGKVRVVIEASGTEFGESGSLAEEANFRNWVSDAVKEVMRRVAPGELAQFESLVVLGPRGMVTQVAPTGNEIRYASATTQTGQGGASCTPGPLRFARSLTSRVPRSVAAAEDCWWPSEDEKTEETEKPEEPEKPGGREEVPEEAVEELEARQVEEAFGELVGKYGVKVVAQNGKQLSPSEIHARFEGYSKLEPEVKSRLRANLKSAGRAGKGALLLVGIGLWAKGVDDAFSATDTTALDKAAALTAIVPFVGCGVRAGADADHGRFDLTDTATCLGTDTLMLTPLWPVAVGMQAADYFTAKWQEAQIPSITTFQTVRDEAWAARLASFREKGLAELVKSAGEAEEQQLAAEKAVILHNTAEQTVEIDRRQGVSDADKRLLKFGIERAARTQMEALTGKLRTNYDKAIHGAIVELANQYNEEFITREINIERWKDESWQTVVQGPTHSRADRQEYLDKLIQRLRDPDMSPPTPTLDTLRPDIEQARAATRKQP
ncbi:hypothetical protein ACWF95_38400 [Streptomyces vinaceus]